jgi:Protein of unknown function (DUF3987)
MSESAEAYAERIIELARDKRKRKAESVNQEQAESPRPLMREMPAPDPFPVEALGTILANSAIGIQDRTQAPVAICGQSVLAAATLVTQGYADVKLPTGQVRPLSNYFATVGVTGERKSAVDMEATWPVRKREAKLREQYGPARLDYENAKDAWDKARKFAMDSAKGDQAKIRAALDRLGPPPTEPLLPRLTCGEPTIEGLVKVFAKGWPSLGIFSDEGGMFIGGHGMTPDAKLRTASTLSKLWDGTPIDRVRSGDGAAILPGRRLAMHLMVQPNVAALFLADGLLAEQGLLSRVLASSPESTIGARCWHEASADSDLAIKTYGGRLLDILEMPLPLVERKRNELTPREISLSTEARASWIAFHDHVEGQMGVGKPLWPIRGLANKLPEIVGRLAGVLALVDHMMEIGVTEIERGIALAEHYAAEALRLFAASQVAAELTKAQELLRWLVMEWEGDIVGLPEIYQRGPNFVRDMKAARALVSLLENHGHLVRVLGGATIGENRRRDAWHIVGRKTR